VSYATYPILIPLKNMSVLLFLISLIVGLLVTAVINRVMAVFYLLMFLAFGIILLIHYKDALSPIIEAILYLILFLFGLCALLLFLYIVYFGICLYIEQYKNSLKNKKSVVDEAAVYGVSRSIKDNDFHEGKRKQLLNECKKHLREFEAKERRSNFDKQDKTRFYLVLKEAVTNNLIVPDDAHQLVQSLENGRISLSEVYQLVEQIFSENPINQPMKVVIDCPNCSQKLRVPSNLGQLNLTCSKCKHSWSCVPQ
jgi:hypothetical protein